MQLTHTGPAVHPLQEPAGLGGESLSEPLPTPWSCQAVGPLHGWSLSLAHTHEPKVYGADNWVPLRNVFLRPSVEQGTGPGVGLGPHCSLGGTHPPLACCSQGSSCPPPSCFGQPGGVRECRKGSRRAFWLSFFASFLFMGKQPPFLPRRLAFLRKREGLELWNRVISCPTQQFLFSWSCTTHGSQNLGGGGRRALGMHVSPP